MEDMGDYKCDANCVKLITREDKLDRKIKKDGTTRVALNMEKLLTEDEQKEREN